MWLKNTGHAAAGAAQAVSRQCAVCIHILFVAEIQGSSMSHVAPACPKRLDYFYVE
jgi:hypothetical protein